MTAALTPRPFTPAALAERWDCSEKHVRSLIRKGALSAFQVGSLWRIPYSEVERYECSGSNSNSTEAGSTPIGAMAATQRDEPFVPRIVRPLSVS